MKNDFSDVRCIAFDLDETVLNVNKGMSGRTRAALEKAAEKGIVLLPVSGRPYASFPSFVPELKGVSYVVTSNGAATYDVRTGERVHEFLLPAGVIYTVMRSMSNFYVEGQITYEAFVDGITYAAEDYVNNPIFYGVPESAVSYIRQTRHPERYIIDFIFEHARQMESLDIILKDPGLYRMIENMIRRNTEDVYITSSTPYRLEISNPEAGKASGMCQALDLLQIPPEETLAFGDGDNDAPMLKAAGFGVAVKNATDSCKESADEVTDLPAQEDGVADFLEKHVICI